MSPDGRLLVYAASSGPGRLMLYRRALDRLSGEPIPGTEGAVQPFFSPDGRSLAFFTVGGELKKVALDGSPPVSLAKEMQNGRFAFGVWRDDNVIVFSAFQNLFQISADGGTPAPLTTLGEGATADLWHQYPAVVPSTGDLIFTVYTANAETRLDILRWDTKTRSTLVDNASGPIVTASGHVLFSRDDRLMAAAWDAKARTLGPVTTLSESVVIGRGGIAQLAVSASGTAAYVAPDPGAPAPVLGWVSRSGTFTEILTLPAGVDEASLSPDGTLAAGLRRGYQQGVHRRSRPPRDDAPDAGQTSRGIGDLASGWEASHARGRLSLAVRSRHRFRDSAHHHGQAQTIRVVGPERPHVAYMTFEPSNDIYVLTLKEDDAPAGCATTSARD